MKINGKNVTSDYQKICTNCASHSKRKKGNYCVKDSKYLESLTPCDSFKNKEYNILMHVKRGSSKSAK